MSETGRIPLPIDLRLPEIVECLGSRPGVVVVAPPGSGKTTRVAPGLLQSACISADKAIWLLQPRRIAARATAQRIAAELGARLGGQVGYQVRFEKKVGPETRLVVATEGILLRRIESDPWLARIGMVVLDEFHERSLNADLLLAMLRRIQLAGREDLRIVVMSATMDAGPVCQFLGNVPLIEAPGLSFPVTIHYQPPPPNLPLVEHVASRIGQVVDSSEGDLLVFLPGAGEIAGVKRWLEGESLAKSCRILALHGSLPLEQQSLVFERSPLRRVILATNVAETSLTIDGVRTVIDSGLARVLRFDPAVGLDRLVLEPVCQASATQRTGRAGRTAEGLCYRLWDQAAHKSRPPWLDPEVRRIDISSAVLQLLAWGEKPDEFPWFETPRPESVDNAVGLLKRLQAIDSAGHLTAMGKSMAALPVPPRVGRLLMAGHELGRLEEVAIVAALLTERDPFVSHRGTANSPSGGRGGPPTFPHRWTCDVTQRVMALQEWWKHNASATPFGEIHRHAADAIAHIASELAATTSAQLGTAPPATQPLETAIPAALLLAMPDRLARWRDSKADRGVMVGGRGIKRGPRSGVAGTEFLLCVDVTDSQTEAVVHQATSIQREWLDPTLIEQRDELFFSPASKQVQQRRREYWDDLLLAETPVAISDRDRCAEILCEAASANISEVLPEGGEPIRQLQARIGLLSREAPELGLAALGAEELKSILKELCRDCRSFEQLRKAPWLDWIRSSYPASDWNLIEREVPERIRVPSQSQIRIEYAEGKPPVLAVRIQEIFSWTSTPRIVLGRVPLLLHLLAPNFRPQQITDDLASFWATTYPLVRGELRRRYPRHAWPEDPLTAAPVKKG